MSAHTLFMWLPFLGYLPWLVCAIQAERYGRKGHRCYDSGAHDAGNAALDLSRAWGRFMWWAYGLGIVLSVIAVAVVAAP